MRAFVVNVELTVGAALNTLDYADVYKLVFACVDATVQRSIEQSNATTF